MRRGSLLLLALAIVVQSSAWAQSPARGARADVPDGIARLLRSVETAMAAGRADHLSALATALPPEGQAIFTRALTAGAITSAAVRERARMPLSPGDRIEVLAEVFVGYGRRGRLSTWLITVRPRAGSPQEYELAALAEPSSFDSLVRLSLTTNKQFAVRNLTIVAPDLTLRMASGSAFVAEDEDGVTALVLRGRGDITFSPADPAEQGELVGFAGRPALETVIDTAFVRLDSGEFESRVARQALTPTPVDPRELARAQVVFGNLARRTYNVDLRDLTREQWSFSPSHGSIVVEFRSARFGWLTYARSPSEAEDVTLFERARGRNVSLYASADTLASRGPSFSEDSNVPYDIERVALDVAIDPRARTIDGRAVLSLRIKSSTASVVTLKLAESLKVASVTSPEFGRLLSMRVVGQNTLIVNLPATVLRDTRLTLDIVYGGQIAPQPVDRESPVGRTQIASSDPNQAAAQDALTIAPEPRFLYSNQVQWYPQAPVSDYATATMRVRVPAEFDVLANGRRVRSAAAPDGSARSGRAATTPTTRAVEYVVDHPVRYLSCLVTRLVDVGEAQVDVAAVAPPVVGSIVAAATPQVRLDVRSTPRIAGANRQLPARVAEMVRVFADILGEAPYPTLTVASVDDNLPGGHSPAFFAIWLQPLSTTPFSWANDPLSLDARHPHFFLAHEVAHQWWGQAVGWKNYHEQWLSEGLAQYFAAIFAGNDRGPAVLHGIISQMRASAMAYTARGPVSLGYRLGHVSGDSRVFRAIVYNKSAVVLHMLRRLIGDEAFFAGLRRYYLDWRWNKAGTDDLRAAFEAETPMRLTRFFDKWIRGATVPRLLVTTTVDAAGTSATIRVEQVGDVFDLPLTITVQYADGTSEAVTIPVVDAVTERLVALKRPVRRIVTRDELTLADYAR
jgi:Peptidase family M1 domain